MGGPLSGSTNAACIGVAICIGTGSDKQVSYMPMTSAFVANMRTQGLKVVVMMCMQRQDDEFSMNQLVYWLLSM